MSASLRAAPGNLFRNALRVPAALGARLGPLKEGHVWVVQRLRPELGDSRNPLASLGRDRGLSFLDELRVLQTARADPRVAGVVLRFQGGPASWNQALALRRAVLDLRASGKIVVAWADHLDAVQYLVASAATRVWLPEVGSLFLIGLRAEQVFLRDLLGQLDVEAEVIRIGSHKAAGELFTRSSMSPESKEQIAAWLDDVYTELVEGVAQGRGLGADAVRALVDGGPHPAPLAAEAGLIDGCLYADEVEAKLAELTPVSPDAEPAPEEPRLVRSDAYFSLRVADPGWRPLLRELPRVAYVVAQGSIHRGTGGRGVGSDRFTRILDGLRERDSIRGVVLRVESPGGDAVASDLLHRAVTRLVEEKPVVVSMGDVAASGGYYLAAPATAIYAEAGTITGSIGVVGGKVNLDGLYRRFGVSKDGVERGARAGMHSDTRGFTPDERAAVKREMESLYRVFRKRVADGRGLSESAVEKVAGGRIWSGLAAKRAGLVDSIGGPLEALADVCVRTGLLDDERFELEVHPQTTRLAGLRALLGGPADDGARGIV